MPTLPDGEDLYILEPYPRNTRWEGLSVSSASFNALPMAEGLYRLSCAYLYSGIVLCERAGDTRVELGWPQASVCYYCLHLATELFLKACILQVGQQPGKPSKHGHEIADLRREYEERLQKLLPRETYWFSTPWALSAKDIQKIVGHEVLHGVDRTPDQLFRYSMAGNGTRFGGNYIFNPGYLFNYMKDLETKWAQIWEKISLIDNG
jgi:hypothetical protein